MTTINRAKFLLTCTIIATLVTAPVFWLLEDALPEVRWFAAVFVFCAVFGVTMCVWAMCFVSSDVDRRM